MTANHSRTILDDIETLNNRIAELRGALALGSQPALYTSTSHPGTPALGRPIYETDTGFQAYWNGSAWEYPPQVIASQKLATAAASVTFSGLPATFSVLRLDWRVHLTSGGPTDLLMQVDGDSTSHYLWAKSEAVSGASGPGHGGAATTFMKIGALGGTTANYFSSGTLSISGWTGTGHLSVSGTSSLFDTNSVDYTGVYGGLYAAPPPHTSLTLFPPSSTFTAGSQFVLSGVA